MCDCSTYIGRQRDLCEGRGREGRPDPSVAAVELWKSRNCQRPIVQDGSPEIQWQVDMPSRGLGDTVAKFTRATGLDKLAGDGCGCKKRQAALNALLPYKSAGETDRHG